MKQIKGKSRDFSGPLLLLLLALSALIVLCLKCREYLDAPQALYVIMSIWTTSFLYWKGVVLAGSAPAFSGKGPFMEGWSMSPKATDKTAGGKESTTGAGEAGGES